MSPVFVHILQSSGSLSVFLLIHLPRTGLIKPKPFFYFCQLERSWCLPHIIHIYYGY